MPRMRRFWLSADNEDWVRVWKRQPTWDEGGYFDSPGRAFVDSICSNALEEATGLRLKRGQCVKVKLQRL
jgi:hypothetical protein